MSKIEDSNDARASLSAFIEEHFESIVDNMVQMYPDIYDYSSSSALPMDAKRQWAVRDVRAILDCVQSGTADPSEYENYGGDIVLQREPLFSPIANYIEGHLYIARVIARIIWSVEMADRQRRDALLSCLEESIQQDIAENTMAFLEEFKQQNALVRTWTLNARQMMPMGSLAVGGSGTASAPARAQTESTPERGLAPLETLTPRERDVFDLVVAGYQNAEIAAELHLQRSTVKNSVSRVFSKFNVGSRAELIIAAHRLGIG